MYVVKIKINGKFFYGVRQRDREIIFTRALTEARIFKKIKKAYNARQTWERLPDVEEAKIVKLKPKVT